MSRVPPWLTSLVRSCFVPRVSDAGDDRRASKFGGTPWLNLGESWPRCGRCAQPLTFFFQLNLDTLSELMPRGREGGILQLFYCTGECESYGGFEAFSPMQNVRRLVPTDEPATPDVTPTTTFPLRLIVGWNEHDDAPCGEELTQRGIELTDDKEQYLEGAELPRQGDKLGGWPSWVQGVEYPVCPRCGDRMQFIFQIDSEDNVPWMFGDTGCGHITQCSTHPDVLAFAWACC